MVVLTVIGAWTVLSVLVVVTWLTADAIRAKRGMRRRLAGDRFVAHWENRIRIDDPDWSLDHCDDGP